MKKNIISDIIKNKEKLLKLKKNDSLSVFKRKSFFLIGEIKISSPSTGVINPNLNVKTQVEAYEKGGASAISVVTEECFFGGSLELLKKVKELTNLPILRKDFIIDKLQIYESFFYGADILLLISSILSLAKLKSFIRLCQDLGLTPLVEVHTEEDLEKAFKAGARLIGINNRNLETLEVSIENTLKLMPILNRFSKNKDILVISESGISSREDVKLLKSIGVNGILVGFSLLTAEDPLRKIKELLEP
ncbi:MAG: indole-3-glycerol phosphate synthase TrpC [Synergistetes bacterium]|nr:indole-3-glycerol phosphate synthase TrpC [Synergistota bacterium]MCX8128003.1 indole-3-glycerol phosphate synthase TrpC [Synergistota bacterium]MDW8192802.1 indole-3-glycerol phosphate synthase TrpC [Synergistota bacterium]